MPKFNQRKQRVMQQFNAGRDIIINESRPAPPSARFQLRAPVADFTGRELEVAELSRAISQASENGATALISGIHGLAGLGKTELAYVVAYHNIDSFPDAQIVVNLHDSD